MLRQCSAAIRRIRISLQRNGLVGFIGRVFVRRIVLSVSSFILPPGPYNALETFLFLGYWPSLANPQTFNEKLLWRKLHDKNPLHAVVADKYRVRDYVASRIGKEALTKLLYVTDDPTTIPFGRLPHSFVIKANYGAGRNIFVKNKEHINEEEIVSRCQAWLGEKGNSRLDKWKYHDLQRLVVIEEMLDCGDREFPVDHKFYVFHGKVRMIEVAADWNSKFKRNLYDEDVHLLDVVWNNRRERIDDLQLPTGFDKMRRVAEVLGAEFDFVSVDLYMVRDACIFGEISLFPEGGIGRFIPRSFDKRLGSYWQIGAVSRTQTAVRGILMS